MGFLYQACNRSEPRIRSGQPEQGWGRWLSTREELSFLYKQPDPWNRFVRRNGIGVMLRVLRFLKYPGQLSRTLKTQPRAHGDSCLFVRWILGAFVFGFSCPSFNFKGLLTTYCLTSSSLLRLNNLRILPALLGPKRRGIVVSVNPGISASPFFTMMRWRTDRFASTIHPLTLLR